MPLLVQLNTAHSLHQCRSVAHLSSIESAGQHGIVVLIMVLGGVLKHSPGMAQERKKKNASEPVPCRVWHSCKSGINTNKTVAA